MLDLRNKHVTVAGLGRFGGGIGVTRWLVEQGARVLVTDKDKPERLADSCRQLEGLAIEYRLGGHHESDFTGCDLVVASPAIRLHNPYLRAATSAGVPVSTEIRLFVERCSARIVGVTGTKGKSTTCAMIHAILSRRFSTHLGGNIGGSLLFDLPAIKPDHLVVLELSSFMLEYLGVISWSPHVAVVTLMADDHIEHHGSRQAYIDAKLNIVRHQGPGDFAVLHESSPSAAAFRQLGAGRRILYGLPGRKPFALALTGSHNQVNAQAAFAAASAFAMSWDEAQEALSRVTNLPHRLQFVHEANGVRYYDDSIATIPEAAIAALDSFPTGTVIQIIGGHDKKLDVGAMMDALARRAKAVLCIGEAGPAFASMLEERHGSAEIYLCRALTDAMPIAKRIAAPGDSVVLAPACSSYDQFTSFEARGDAFAALARR